MQGPERGAQTPHAADGTAGSAPGRIRTGQDVAVSSDLVAFALVLLDVLVVALILTAALLVPIALSRRLLPHRADPTAPAVLRRCRSCGRRWEGHPGDDPPAWLSRLRRRARRKARGQKRPEPAWARARGYDRCPSCLSHQVRDSRQQHDSAEVSP